MFERFDDHALAAIEATRAAAAGLGHNFLGPEHLLLGLLANPDTTAARLLTSRGIDAQAIRRGIAKVVPIPDRPFRDPAPLLSTLGIDLDEIRRRAETTFGADTIHRVTTRETRQRRRPYRFGLCTPVAPSLLGIDPLGFTPRAQRTLELADQEADRRRQPVTPVHLLLGILTEAKGLACEILTDAGVPLDDLATTTRIALDQPPRPPT